MKGKTSGMLRFAARRGEMSSSRFGLDEDLVGPANDSGGGNNKRPGVKPLKVGNEQYWPPYGIPVPGKDNQLYVLGGEAYIKDGQSITGVLTPDWTPELFHSVKKIGNRDMLLKRFQDHAHLKSYPCTFDPFPPIPGMDDGSWTPNDNWGIDEKGNWLLHGRNNNFVSVVTPSGSRWEVIPPKALSRFRRDETYDTLDEAMLRGEQMLLAANSCAYCAQVQFERLQKVKKEDQSVWAASRQMLLPMFSFRRLELNGGSAEKAGYPRATDNLTPKNYILQGWSWFRVSAPASVPKQSQKYRSWDNWRTYVTSVACLCKACMKGGKRTGAHDNEITVKKLSCRECGCEVFDEHSLMDRTLFRRTPVNEDGNLDWSKSGIFQLRNEPVSCPECGHRDILVAETECSSCDSPTPTDIHEVLTDISQDPGGFLQFEIRKMKDGRILWSPDDLKKVPVSNPSIGKSVWDVIEDGIKAINEMKFTPDYIDVSGGAEDYPQFETADQQAKFLRAEVWGYTPIPSGGGSSSPDDADDVDENDANHQEFSDAEQPF